MNETFIYIYIEKVKPEHLVRGIKIPMVCDCFFFLEKKACISLTAEKEYNRELELTDHPRPE